MRRLVLALGCSTALVACSHDAGDIAVGPGGVASLSAPLQVRDVDRSSLRLSGAVNGAPFDIRDARPDGRWEIRWGIPPGVPIVLTLRWYDTSDLTLATLETTLPGVSADGPVPIDGGLYETATHDRDGDDFSNVEERRCGSDPFEAGSLPDFECADEVPLDGDDDDDDVVPVVQVPSDVDGMTFPFDETTDAVVTDTLSTDVNGDGTLDDLDDVNGDGIIDDLDVAAFGAGQPSGEAILPFGSDYRAPGSASLTLIEAVANVPDLSSFAMLVGNCPGIAAAMSDPAARLTLFAPTDNAFGGGEAADALGRDDVAVCDVLGGHLLNDTVADAASLAGTGGRATTVAGFAVAIGSGPDGVLTVGGARMVSSDLFAVNGVIHIIDSIILPLIVAGRR